MICVIEKPNPNIIAAVQYNERKMNGDPGIRPSGAAGLEAIEDGYVLATRNVPDGSTLADECERLRMLALKTVGAALKNSTFHMSVNPSETDGQLSDASAVDLIDEIMAALGYGAQPYRVYKHQDIARIHYHVVSSRCGQDGRKVNDSYEWRKLRKTLEELAPRYGFAVVEKGESRRTDEAGEKHHAAAEAEPKPKVVHAFSRKDNTPVTWQLKDAFEDALRWSFSSFEQFQALMQLRYNALVEIETGKDDEIVISGTAPNGKQVTPILHDADLGIPMLGRIRERMATPNMGARKEQKKKIVELSLAAANASGSFKEYVANMERKGAYVFVSFTSDGKPFGLTYLDRRTKCAWKGSETSTDLQWLLEVAEKKGWELERDSRLATASRRNAMPSRKKEIPVHRKPLMRPSPKSGKASGIVVPTVTAVSHHIASNGPAVRKGEDTYEESIEAGEQEEREERARKRHPRSI